MNYVSTYGLKRHKTNTDGFAFEKTTRKLQALSGLPIYQGSIFLSFLKYEV